MLQRNTSDSHAQDKLANMVKLVEYTQDIDERGIAGLTRLLEACSLMIARSDSAGEGTYMYMYACMYIRMCMYACINVCMHECMYANLCTWSLALS